MTPHILLLSSHHGDRFLITIQAIETIDLDADGGCLIYTTQGAKYAVQESFNSIVEALGGLVMRPKEALR